MKLKHIALAAAGMAVGAHAFAQVTFYENDDYQGRSFTTQGAVRDMSRFGFNDRASSVIVDHGRWEVCENASFAGRCVVLRPGSYSSLGAMSLNDRVSSVRQLQGNARVDDSRYAPPAQYTYQRRGNEPLYQANVTSVRAVVGAPEQRCWTERQDVQERRPNVGGAVVGGILGGILGHQIGGGTGRNIATVGGAVAGGAIGANVNRDDRVASQNVQRCANVQRDQTPEYYDVTYNFRGQEHHVQMTQAPGATVTVNRDGEPRAS